MAAAQTIETLVKRIEMLETELKSNDQKLNRIGGVMMIGIFAALLTSGYLFWKRIGLGKQVVTKELLIQDEDGVPRLWTGINVNGPGIGISGEDGKTRIWVGLYNELPSISIFGPDGKLRGSFGEGGPKGFLHLYDKEGTKIFTQP